jgi:hypothetical protein
MVDVTTRDNLEQYRRWRQWKFAQTEYTCTKCGWSRRLGIRKDKVLCAICHKAEVYDMMKAWGSRVIDRDWI